MTGRPVGTADQSAPVELVVVGASLGGLSALRILLAALPADFAPAVAIVQHRRADADSRLTELLRMVCRLPVLEAEDKDNVRGGSVYLAPANYHLLVEAGRFSLSIDPPVRFARPSIDVLFESAADAVGRAVVAVVLTGSNDDGAAGAQMLKRAGATVLVEDPRTAESPVLPAAVIAKAAVDVVLPIAALARHLVDIVKARQGSTERGGDPARKAGSVPGR